MSGWRDAVASPSTGGTGILHPDWLLEQAMTLWGEHKHTEHAIATALMTPPPKPPVDDATLCWRETSAEHWPAEADEYLSGERDTMMSTSRRYDIICAALNWAKNREKRDGEL